MATLTTSVVTGNSIGRTRRRGNGDRNHSAGPMPSRKETQRHVSESRSTKISTGAHLLNAHRHPAPTFEFFVTDYKLWHNAEYPGDLMWRPHGDSNPGYRRERAMSGTFIDDRRHFAMPCLPMKT